MSYEKEPSYPPNVPEKEIIYLVYHLLNEDREFLYKAYTTLSLLSQSRIEEAPKLYKDLLTILYEPDKYIVDKEEMEDFLSTAEEIFGIKIENGQ